LEAYQKIQEGKLSGRKLPPGALLPTSQVKLHLHGVNESFDIEASTPKDPYLQKGLEAIFASADPSYSIAILDITDPKQPAYAAIREGKLQFPGSIGKLAVVSGLFAALAQHFPDISDRSRILKETKVKADRWILRDSHEVPVVTANGELVNRAIAIGDIFSFWEWADHMLSPSSNAAATMTWKQALLIREYGKNYPPSPQIEEQFFKTTPKSELSRKSAETVNAPLKEVGLDPEGWRLGTFFTDGAEAVIPGSKSYANPRELLRFLLKLEQGKIVDPWSSLEVKKLMYMTRRRYRYAISPALTEAAIYFKSGSLYECKPEPGFKCGKYKGNVKNYMNSVAIIESPAKPGSNQSQKVYLVALMSNVLRKNSAEDHRDLATRIEELIRKRKT
jgi:hypothetical protein